VSAKRERPSGLRLKLQVSYNQQVMHGFLVVSGGPYGSTNFFGEFPLRGLLRAATKPMLQARHDETVNKSQKSEK
jgi:hypothetical protein